MSPTQNEAIKICLRYGLWIKEHKEWFSPHSFMIHYRARIIDRTHRYRMQFLNPVEELHRGKATLIRWVNEDKPKDEIAQGIRSLGDFVDIVGQYYRSVAWTLEMNGKDEAIRSYLNSDVPDEIKFDIHLISEWGKK